jgi:C4-dicarboxylate transporter DctQ subunit
MELMPRILDFIEDLFAFLAISILLFISASVCLEVVMRYGFNDPLIWVVEISESALLYITLRNNGHVRIDILVDRVSSRLKYKLGFITSTIGLTVSIIFTIWGGITTWDHFLRGLYKPTVLEIPSWLLLIVIPLGSLLVATRFFRQALSYWQEYSSKNLVSFKGY